MISVRIITSRITILSILPLLMLLELAILITAIMIIMKDTAIIVTHL